MGAEFLSCSYCGEGFSDYDAGWTSCRCGRNWCSPECAEEDGYCEVDGEQSCNFCRGDDFEDYELLNFVVSALGVSRDDLVAFYKESEDQLKKGNICKFNGRINFSSSSKTGDTVIVNATLGRMPKIGVTKIGVKNE